MPSISSFPCRKLRFFTCAEGTADSWTTFASPGGKKRKTPLLAKSCSRRSDLVGSGDVSREKARGEVWVGGKGGVPRLPFPVSHPFPRRFVLLGPSRRTEGLKQANLATLGHARTPTNGISFYRLDPFLYTLFRLKTSFLGRSEMVRPSAFLRCRSEMVRPSAFLRCCIINRLSPNCDENNISLYIKHSSAEKKGSD